MKLSQIYRNDAGNLRKDYIVFICLFLLFASAALLHSLLRYEDIVNIYDDGLMYYRYAFNIVEHGVYGWNKYPSNGCTSTLYTLISCIPVLINKAFSYSLSPVKLMMAMSYFFYLFFAGLVAWQMVKKRVDIVKAVALLLLLTLSKIMLTNMVNGLESSFAGLMLSIYILFFYKQKGMESFKSILTLAFFSYLIVSTRPEALVFLAGLHLGDLLRQEDKKKRLVSYFKYLALLVILIGLDSFIKYLYFGYVLPLPYYIKQGGFYNSDIYSTQFRWTSPVYFFLLNASAVLLLLLRNNWRNYLPIITALMAIVLYLTTVDHIMGMWARLTMPYLMAAIYAAIITYVSALRAPRIGKSLTVAASLGIILFTLRAYDQRVLSEGNAIESAYSSEYEDYMVDFERARVYEIHEAYNRFAKVLTLLPASTSIAAGEHGAIAAFNPEKKIIDFMGLHTEEIALGQDALTHVIQESPDIVHMPHPTYIALRKQFVDYYSNPENSYIYDSEALLFGTAYKNGYPEQSKFNKIFEGK